MSAAAGTAGAPARSAFTGVAFMLGALLCFAALDTTAQHIARVIPILMAVWLRYLFQALATTAVVLPLRGRAVLRSAHPRFQLLRGVLLALCSVLAFYSLKHMPVSEFTGIVMITPLAVTLGSALLFKERVSALRWLLVLGGFVGALIIVRPGGPQFSVYSLLPLALVLCNAAFQLLTSRLARSEDPVTTHFYTGWIGTLVFTPLVPLAWTSLNSPSLWALMVFLGVMGALGHFLFILAFSHAQPAVLAPYLYAHIAFATLGGWLVFSYLPDGWALLGLALVALCGVAGAWLTVLETRNTRAASAG